MYPVHESSSRWMAKQSAGGATLAPARAASPAVVRLQTDGGVAGCGHRRGQDEEHQHLHLYRPSLYVVQKMEQKEPAAFF